LGRCCIDDPELATQFGFLKAVGLFELNTACLAPPLAEPFIGSLSIPEGGDVIALAFVGTLGKSRASFCLPLLAFKPAALGVADIDQIAPLVGFGSEIITGNKLDRVGCKL
jgi:hypothetical protein